MKLLIFYILILTIIIIIFSYQKNYKWYRRMMGSVWYGYWSTTEHEFFYSRDSFGYSIKEDYTINRKEIKTYRNF